MTVSVTVRYEIMKLVKQEEVEIPDTTDFDQFKAAIAKVDQLFSQQRVSLSCDQEVVTQDNFRRFMVQKKVFTVRISY